MHIVTASSKENNGWKITKLTKQGMGPDKDSLLIIKYKYYLAIVDPNHFNIIDGKETDQPVILYFLNMSDMTNIIPYDFVDKQYLTTIGQLITDELFFNELIKDSSISASKSIITVPDEFTQRCKYEINNFR